MPPGVPLERLPAIDLVLISHDHYDHLDVETVQQLARLYHPLFLVPLGLKAWFVELGIWEVEELDWWESRQVYGLTVTCLSCAAFLWAYAVGWQSTAVECMGGGGREEAVFFRR